ncbi:MAG: DUF2958 domain-containing protein [Rhodobacteraceae bacterium]|nr:DUF2958 domain-containing protein [Paracoccaceae bacterium]
MMKLLTKNIERKLLANGNAIDNGATELSLTPVVRLFTPDAAATWVLVSAEPWGDDLRLFGWCDLGVGFPEYGYVSLNELQCLRGRLGLPVERDLHFKTCKTLETYISTLD